MNDSPRPDDSAHGSSATDDIAFLANSENRQTVLRSLTDGTHSRHVLTEETGVARVTLGRILDELEDRRWIIQRGQVNEITALGEWVIEAFDELHETMTAAGALRPVMQWLPEEGFGFHISCIADAEITFVSRADASAPITRLVREIEHDGPVRAFSFAITSQFLEACWRGVTAGRIRWTWVFTTAVFDVLKANPEMASQSREMLESGRAEYFLFDGEIPYVVILSPALVNLRLADADGAATALIQSDDETVRSWAESTFDSYRRGAIRVEPDAFAT